MICDERREKILEIILRQGSVNVNELAAALSVTGETIRRDLTALGKKHAIKKCMAAPSLWSGPCGKSAI